MFRLVQIRRYPAGLHGHKVTAHPVDHGRKDGDTRVGGHGEIQYEAADAKQGNFDRLESSRLLKVARRSKYEAVSNSRYEREKLFDNNCLSQKATAFKMQVKDFQISTPPSAIRQGILDSYGTRGLRSQTRGLDTTDKLERKLHY